MNDLLDRLRANCKGYPTAKVPWPHRLLHEAANEIERLRFERDEALELRDNYSGLYVQIQQELDHYNGMYRRVIGLLYPHGIDNDHMTSCDKTMGDSHLCTCGADSLREYFMQKDPADRGREHD